MILAKAIRQVEKLRIGSLRHSTTILLRSVKADLDMRLESARGILEIASMAGRPNRLPHDRKVYSG
jgi:hypothetical protein